MLSTGYASKAGTSHAPGAPRLDRPDLLARILGCVPFGGAYRTSSSAVGPHLAKPGSNWLFERAVGGRIDA
jgi:hypothetical protein